MHSLKLKMHYFLVLSLNIYFNFSLITVFNKKVVFFQISATQGGKAHIQICISRNHISTSKIKINISGENSFNLQSICYFLQSS